MKRINNPTSATLPFDQEALPALAMWTGATPNGIKAEYRYHQSKSGAWASRKVGDFLDTLKRVSHGLSRKQVEALFAKLDKTHERQAADKAAPNAVGETAGS